jgi:hypothetical protein
METVFSLTNPVKKVECCHFSSQSTDHSISFENDLPKYMDMLSENHYLPLVNYSHTVCWMDYYSDILIHEEEFLAKIPPDELMDYILKNIVKVHI